MLVALFSLAAVQGFADGMSKDGGMGMPQSMSPSSGTPMGAGMGMSKAELMGSCPVALAKMSKALPGDARFASMFQGKTYYCGSAKAKAMYDKNPKKYLDAIAYAGNCAVDLSMGKTMAGNPAVNSTYQGKIYLFCNADEKMAFDKDPKSVVDPADKQWGMMKKM
jgi:YHS domain-containing protein